MSRAASSAIRAVLTLLALAATLGAGAAFAGTDVGSVNFVLGRKSLANEWTQGPGTLDTTARVGQPSLGFELSWGKQGWPVMVAFDVLHSYDDGIIHIPAFFGNPAIDLLRSGRTLEVGLGLRRTFSALGWSPYLGAGGSWVRGDLTVKLIDPNASQYGTVTSAAHARSTAFGYWVGGGLVRRIGPRFQIGLAGRYSKATLPSKPAIIDQGPAPFGITSTPELDGGGRHVNLVVGWSFPVRK